MERMTWRLENGEIECNVAKDDCFQKRDCRGCEHFQPMLDHLSAYEDIGLEPDKITDLLYSAVKLISSMRNNKKAALWMGKYGRNE